MTAELFDLVRTYADFGVHRTGAPSQLATADWLADELAARGGAVEQRTIDFERFIADWSVTIDGSDVEALPLFYEATGNAASTDPVRWSAFSPHGSGPMGTTAGLEVDDAVAGDLVVAATQNLRGLLGVPNREPTPGSGIHVLQVAGRHGQALAEGAAVTAQIDSRIETASCRNVVARFGNVDDGPLTVVTTPISGWFACAGERGTGIAVALDVVARLAEETAVVFLGATGHELGAFGAHALHAEFADQTDVLLHVGANVGCDWAAGDGLTAPDHSHMAARFVGDSAAEDPVRDAFAPTGHGLDTPGRDRSQWFGEAADWLDAPTVLSLLGQNPWFHAPSDLPDVSCTAERTELVAVAFTEAALRIVGH